MSTPSGGEWCRLRTSPSSDRRRDPRSVLGRLEPERRFAALAAAGLALSLFLPWWRDPVFGVSYIGLRRLTFLELALFAVAAAVGVLILRRAEGNTFHLPLSDGTLIAAAGAWASFLVVLRLLDPPSRTITSPGGAVQVTRDYGLRWGALFALASACLLALSGVRIRRRHHHGEPEAIAADADAMPTLPLER
jgi:hypothetical protein